MAERSGSANSTAVVAIIAIVLMVLLLAALFFIEGNPFDRTRHSNTKVEINIGGASDNAENSGGTSANRNK